MTISSPAMPATWWRRMETLARSRLLTSVNVQTKDLQSETMITQEHIDNNAAVRRILLERGVVPEDLPAEEDVKKVERRLASEKKKAIENKRKK